MWWLSFLFLFLGSQNNPVFGDGYGPPLDFLIPPKGDPGPRKEINLDAFSPTYAVALPLTNGSNTAHVAAVHPQGEFSILAPADFGIMVVIQALRLRTGVFYSREEDTTFLKCRDWVRFTAGNFSSQVCGHVTKYSKEGNPVGLLGQRVFLTPLSQLTVALHIDTNLDRNDYGWHETIGLEIVVTAYKECPKKTIISQWKKLTGSNPWRSCSPAEDKVCVHKATFCDGVGNCGVKGPLGHIGYDEENCKRIFSSAPPTNPPITIQEEPFSTKTPYIGVNKPYTPPAGKIISPIHLILIFSIVVLIIFGACTWLAKANEKKFQHTVYRFSTMRRNRRNRERGRDRRDQDRSTSSSDDQGTVRRPSAPAAGDVEIGGIPGEEPPPYTDLFPTAPPSSTPNSTLS